MPLLYVALMGFFLLPGSATAPVHAAEVASVPVASVDDEPSPAKAAVKVATAHEPASSYTVSMTAYNAVPEQTDSNPLVTASGAPSNPEVVAARSRDLAQSLPFGTVIKIERTSKDSPRCNFSAVEPQIGYRVIADTMDSRWENKIDVLFDKTDTVSIDGRETNPSIAMGVCSGVTVSVVGHVEINHMPTTQAELVYMFGSPELAMR